MEAFIPYILIAIIIVGHMCTHAILSKKRRDLDLTKPEDAKKEKTLKLIMPMLYVQNAVMIFIVLYFVKPIFQDSP